MAVKDHNVARKLHELIAALDRRVPRAERAGEASIGRDAAALRQRAVNRLAELLHLDTRSARVDLDQDQ